jgi:hypothetical protein
MLRRMLAESIHICAAWTGKAASGVGRRHRLAGSVPLTLAADGR